MVGSTEALIWSRIMSHNLAKPYEEIPAKISFRLEALSELLPWQNLITSKRIDCYNQVNKTATPIEEAKPWRFFVALNKWGQYV